MNAINLIKSLVGMYKLSVWLLFVYDLNTLNNNYNFYFK